MAYAPSPSEVGSSGLRGFLVTALAFAAVVCSPAAAEAQPWALDRYAPVPVISGGPSGQTTADTADFGLSLQEGPPPVQVYADVPSGSPLYEAVQREADRGVVSGYACGGASEPCDGGSRPYFRPDQNLTRGQLARLLNTAAGWSDAVNGQTFTDIPPGNLFYVSIEHAVSHGAISGYASVRPVAARSVRCAEPAVLRAEQRRRSRRARRGFVQQPPCNAALRIKGAE